MSTYCDICNKTIDVELEFFSKSHLKWSHKISAKEYYDRCIKSNGDGECVMCGLETKFISITDGYKRTCGHRCGAHLRSKELELASGVTNVSQLQYVKQLKQDTCIERFGHTTHLSSEAVKSSIKKTCIKKYGVDNPSKSESVKSKRKSTILSRYGTDSYAKTLTFRQTQEELGLWMPIEHKSDFEIYRMLAWGETNKWKKQLFENWNGLCAYTHKRLLTEVSDFNNPLYATIDHKTSVFFGFKENIDPFKIGHIDNLCICSRSINSIKNVKTDKQFLDFLQEKK